MIIYKATNKITGESYIGKTKTSLKQRWQEHCRKSRQKVSALTSAIHKYGKDAFEIKILVRCDNTEQMNHREMYYIKLFNTLAPSGYNLTYGGEGGTHSEQTRLKISKANKGHIVSKESRKKMSAAKKGKFLSEEHKKSMSEAKKGEKNHFFGKTHTKETRAKLSQYATEQCKNQGNPMFGKRHTEESKRKMSESQKLVWATKHD